MKDSESEDKNKETSTNPADNEPIIVGIGASAGGLKAIEQFLRNMPPDKGIAFVIIQHLDPLHKSLLSEILQRSTSMPVQQAENNIEVKANKIYVIPPGHDITLEKNTLVLKKQKNPRGVPLPIDYFFRSLKHNRHERAIGIVLSGTGSDGTLGLREIKAEHGMIMVQSPETADHKGMIENALATGLVDYVLPPEKMPEKLIDFIDKLKNNTDSIEPSVKSELSKYIKDIFELLKAQTKHDFSDYKQSTVIRRIERRIAVNALGSIEEYIELLKSNPTEVDALFKEFLIGVTSFFRDKDAFQSLEKNVLPGLISIDREDPVRVWVTGCSTGEEAYSLAIVLYKNMQLLRITPKIQIFASDIDEMALDSARKGCYPVNIQADVPKEYLDKYFQKNETNYQIKKEIRDLVVFANQSIIKDPPYSRIDLISCRNLLIYLKADIQTRILDTFHYALKDSCYLFLGNSESLGTKKDLFQPVDPKWKIFQKQNVYSTGRSLLPFSGKNYTYYAPDRAQKSDKPKVSIKEFAEKAVREKYMYPFLIINKDGEIMYSIGDLQNYFVYPVGEPNNNILSVTVEPLKVPLANAIRSIRTNKEEVIIENIRIDIGENAEIVRLRLSPIKKPASLSNLFIVLIQPFRSVKGSLSEHNHNSEHLENQDEYIKSIESELFETRDYLQNVIEELETSNEELKSANEEAQSSNEELQSSNEELETSKEELQSLNEELETSNHELQRKISELTNVNNDINNFITSTHIGVIFLDKEMKIQRFTPSMKKIINLLDSDIGRPITNLVTNINNSDLVADAEKVLETLIPKETEVNITDDGTFWMRILPYRTMDDSIDGIVITFTEITELKKAQADVLRNKERFEMLFERMNSGIIVIEALHDDDNNVIDGLILNVNKAYWRHTGITEQNIIGKNLKEVFPKYRHDLLVKYANLWKNNESFESTEFAPQFNKHLRISAYGFGENKYIVIFDDITEKIKAEKAVAESEAKFRGLFDSMVAGIVLFRINHSKTKKETVLKVDQVNPAFTEITGIKADKITNNNLLKTLVKEGIEIAPDSISENGELTTEIFWTAKEKHLRIMSFPLQGNLNVMMIQDITREKNELVARRHLSAIVESSEDAIYSVSLDGKIISWNKGAEKFYGYKYSEIIGKDVTILSIDDQNTHQKLIEKVKNKNIVKNIELIQRNKKGQKIPVSLTKSPIYNDQEEVVAISDVVKDMTKVKKREEALREAKQKSDEAARLKTSFLQNVSHEIRTPMNSIIGFTDLLKNEQDKKKSERFMHAIDENGHRLIHLIDDILDVSRIEAGELTVSKENVNLTQLMLNTKEQFEGFLLTKNKERLKLQLTLPEGQADEFLYTDPDRLQQIVSNLVSNAVKYTDKGSVEFGYKKEGKDLLFFVKDTGKGIRKDNLTRIFTRFQRVGMDSKDVFSGTGLGLSIAKGLTEMLGGKIWCESKYGVGSSFFFTVPDKKTKSRKKEEEQPESIHPEKDLNLKGMNILVAEDDEFSFALLQNILSDTGANIIHADNGEKAIQLFKNHSIDLALLDIRLPKKSGFDILKAIREQQPNLPVIAQTAHAMQEDRKTLIEKGFDAYLIKPITSNALCTKIRLVLNK